MKQHTDCPINKFQIYSVENRENKFNKGIESNKGFLKINWNQDWIDGEYILPNDLPGESNSQPFT